MRRKGGLTIALAWLLIMCIGVGIVLVDYVRIDSSKVKVSRSLKNASEMVLMSYDKNLYEDFRIYGVSSGLSQGQIQGWLDIGLMETGSSPTHLALETKVVTAEFRGSLNQPEAIKAAILSAHGERFVVESAADWLEQLSFFQNLSSLLTSLEATVKIFESLEGLQKDYTEMSKQAKEIKGLLSSLPVLDFQTMASNYRNLQMAMGSFAENLAGIQEALQSSKLSKTERAALVTQKNELQRLLKDARLAIADLEGIVEQVAAINLLIKDYHNSWLSFSKSFGALLSNVEVLLEETEKEEDDSASEDGGGSEVKQGESGSAGGQGDAGGAGDAGKAGKSGKFTLSPSVRELMGTIIGELKAANKVIEKGVRLSRACSLEVEIALDTLRIALSTSDQVVSGLLDPQKLLSALAWEAISCFAPSVNRDALSGELDFEKIVTAMWQAVAGDWMKLGDAYVNVIPEAEYAKLPSRRHPDGQKENLFTGKESEGRGSIQAMLNRFKSSCKDLGGAFTVLDIRSEAIWQRVVVSDYILRQFSYNVESDFEDDERAKDAMLSLSEVEYILNGHRQTAFNAFQTDGNIAALRLILNGASLMLTKQGNLQQLAIQISAFSAGLGYPVVYGALLVGWAGLETFCDMKALHKGNDVVVFKRADEFTIDLRVDNIMAIISWMSTVSSDTASQSDKKTIDPPTKNPVDDNLPPSSKEIPKQPVPKQKWQFPTIKMGYKDYLRLLLLSQDENEQLLRIADVWQLSTGLDMSKVYRGLVLQATIHLTNTALGVSDVVFEGDLGRDYDGLWLNVTVH